MKKTILVLTFFLSTDKLQEASPAAQDFRRPQAHFRDGRWTDKTELFMEYPPLVAGKKARFSGPFHPTCAPSSRSQQAMSWFS